MGTRWARFVLRRPVAVLLLGVVGLGAIAVPATQLELGLPDDGSQPTPPPSAGPTTCSPRASAPASTAR